jgi:class 3 adenylate cyclase
MKSNFISYNYLDSIKRIKDIIATQDKSFEEPNSVPSRDKLTFTNGYYVNVSVIFIDIRNSTELSKNNTFRNMARLYRVYISEVVAILNGFEECSEVFIEGDGVWAVFDTPFTNNVDNLFLAACEVNSLIDIINYFLKSIKINTFNIGIGLDYGRALMIKAGYNGSAINDVVWTGDVVTKSIELCNYGSKNYNDNSIMLTDVIYNNLNEHNKKLCNWNSSRGCYHSNAIIIEMNDWYLKNCK